MTVRYAGPMNRNLRAARGPSVAISVATYILALARRRSRGAGGRSAAPLGRAGARHARGDRGGLRGLGGREQLQHLRPLLERAAPRHRRLLPVDRLGARRRTADPRDRAARALLVAADQQLLPRLAGPHEGGLPLPHLPGALRPGVLAGELPGDPPVSDDHGVPGMPAAVWHRRAGRQQAQPARRGRRTGDVRGRRGRLHRRRATAAVPQGARESGHR